MVVIVTVHVYSSIGLLTQQATCTDNVVSTVIYVTLLAVEYMYLLTTTRTVERHSS